MMGAMISSVAASMRRANIRAKQAQAASTASEVELRALFADMIDVVVVYDADGRYVKNGAFLYLSIHKEYVLHTAKSLLCDGALFEELKQRREIEHSGNLIQLRISD